MQGMVCMAAMWPLTACKPPAAAAWSTVKVLTQAHKGLMSLLPHASACCSSFPAAEKGMELLCICQSLAPVSLLLHPALLQTFILAHGAEVRLLLQRKPAERETLWQRNKKGLRISC